MVVVALAPQPALPQSAPHLFYSDLESGPNSGGQNNAGAFVTIYGMNFGASQGGSFVTIGGGQAATYPVWSDTKITFQLGSAAFTGNIVVKTAAGASNGIPFTVRSGKIYFVSTSGNDGHSGSFGSQWNTLPHAVQTIHSGDIIYALDGVSQTTDDGQGWNAALTLRADWCSSSRYPRALLAYPGASVTVGNPNGSSPPFGIRSTDSSSSGGACGGYWVFGELLLRGLAPVAVAGPSSQWRFAGNDISCPNMNGGGGCLETSQASDVKVYGNVVHDAGAMNASALFHGVYFSTDSNHIDMGWNTVYNVRGCRGVQVHSSPIDSNSGYNQYDITIHDNLIHDTQCDGIIIDTVDPSKGPVSIYNNIIYNAGKGPNNPERTGDWACIYVPGSTESGAAGTGTVDIFNNTMYACGTFATPPYSNANAAVIQGGANSNLFARIRDNVIYQAPTSLYPSGVPYLVIWNPTSTSAGGVCADTDNCPWIQGSNNLFFGSGPAPGNTNITASLNADPLFVNLPQLDFHLTPASPARGKGVNTGILTDKNGNPRGGASGYDIGTFQFPVPKISSLTCVPVQIVTPGTTACTVSLTASAPAGGLQVQLTSDNANVSLLASLTVPAGSSTAIFSAKTLGVGAATVVTLTAATPDGSQTFAITLLPPGDPGPIVSATVNTASYLAGPVSPGEVVTCFGSSLGPAIPAIGTMDPQGWPTALAGTAVLFDGVAGQLLYVQSSRVDVLVPPTVASKTLSTWLYKPATSNPRLLACQFSRQPRACLRRMRRGKDRQSF